MNTKMSPVMEKAYLSVLFSTATALKTSDNYYIDLDRCADGFSVRVPLWTKSRDGRVTNLEFLTEIRFYTFNSEKEIREKAYRVELMAKHGLDRCFGGVPV